MKVWKLTDDEKAQTRTVLWDYLSGENKRAALQKIVNHGITCDSARKLARFACKMVLYECEVRSQVKLEVGGVLP